MKLSLAQFYQLYYPFFRFFRQRRMRQFQRAFQITSQTRVLDIGGYEFNWTLLTVRPNLTLVNLEAPAQRNEGVTWIVADGRNLPFPAAAFDIVYSNSVIEHLGSAESQRRFAAECARVGERYYVQTPNRSFPIEPHYVAFFLHWLPRPWQIRLLPVLSLRGWLTRPTPAQCAALVDEIRLLNKRELHALFPDAQIWHERLAGLTKSLLAVRSHGRDRAELQR